MGKIVFRRYIKNVNREEIKRIQYFLLKKEICLHLFSYCKKKNNIKSSVNRLFFINSMRM